MKVQQKPKLTPNAKPLTMRRAIAEFALAIGVVLTASAISLTTATAWGPERQTYTMEQPAKAPTFNSITNNSVIGDERNFVRVREAGAGSYIDTANIEPGKKYEVYIFFHNNAAANYNTDALGSGIAMNVRMRSSFPKKLTQGETGTIIGELTSGTKVGDTWTNSNVNPPRVWDEAYITATTDLTLHYVSGSAIVHSNGAINGQGLSENLFSDTGTFIGYSGFNGILPGCNEYAGYVIYQIEAEKAEFTATKEVAREGEFSDSVTALPGDIVKYRLTYQNTGTTNQYNVVAQDFLPDGLTFVPGSTLLYNKGNPDGLGGNDDLFGNGIAIGTYGPTAQAALTYEAKVASADELECGWTDLDNRGLFHTGDGDQEDSARVRVYKDCGEERPPEEPEPETPTELPETGPVEIVGAVVGTAMIAVAAAYYIKSRKVLQS